MKFGNTRTEKRFNLIELILIITVCIGLSSLLLPVIYGTMLHAQSTTCIDNLRNMGTSMTNYTSSYKGYLPAYEEGWVAKFGQAGNKTVNQTKAPEGFFACPSQKDVSYKAGIPSASWWRGSHYGINQHLASNLVDEKGRVTRHWTQVKVTDIRDPSLKVVMADATGGNVLGIDGRDPVIAGISLDGETYADCLPPKPTIGMPYMRHADGKGNFLFLDSHVESRMTWPPYMLGRGTRGFAFWHGEHWLKELTAREERAKEADRLKRGGGKPPKKNGK